MKPFLPCALKPDHIVGFHVWRNPLKNREPKSLRITFTKFARSRHGPRQRSSTISRGYFLLRRQTPRSLCHRRYRRCSRYPAWSVTKTVASSTTIPVDRSVTDRIRRLNSLVVAVLCGGSGAKRRIKLVRSDGPADLVFQSLRKGAPMRDGNILRRHLCPAAIKLGIDPK